MAGATVGPDWNQLCETRQLHGLGARLAAGAVPAGRAAKGELAPVAGRDRGSDQPGAGTDSGQMGSALLLGPKTQRYQVTAQGRKLLAALLRPGMPRFLN